MSRYQDEWEDVYIKEKIMSPHCDTCDCRRKELEVRRQITRSPVRRRTPCEIAYRRPSRYNLSEPISSCTCDCEFERDICLCYECRKIRGRSEASVHKKRRVKFSSHKHSLLHTWFSRFDSDGDGYLDAVDLESLLKDLGVKMQHSYSKRLLKSCDRDCDGLISFPEFIRLWKCAALHDESFVRSTGRCNLSPIIKKYELYPDTRGCDDFHCRNVIVATEYPVQSVKCNCGLKERILPFVKHEPKHHPRKSKHSQTENNPDLEDPDKLPTMSSNRYNVM